MDQVKTIAETVTGNGVLKGNFVDRMELVAVPGAKNIADSAERNEVCPKHGSYSSKRVMSGKAQSRWSACEACRDEWFAEQSHRLSEEERRDRTARLIKSLEIPLRFKGKTLENFEVEAVAQQIVIDQAQGYVSEFDKNLRIGKSLIFVGPVGTGKTHVACGILRALAMAGHSGRYATVGGLIRNVRSAWRKSSPQSEEEIRDLYISPRLTVVDEIGMQFGSEAEKVQMFDLLNERYNQLRPTILISNLNI